MQNSVDSIQTSFSLHSWPAAGLVSVVGGEASKITSYRIVKYLQARKILNDRHFISL